MTRRRRVLAVVIAATVAFLATRPFAESMVQLDPFAQATHGDPGCRVPPPPLLTAEAARHEAHVRVERGLRCAMEGRCEPGGAYRRDPEINESVRTSLVAEPRFATTSIWITTTRQWVTLQGCVRSRAQRTALVRFVQRLPNVVRVFDETKLRR